MADNADADADIEVLSHEQFKLILDRLGLLLEQLPGSLPIKVSAESAFAVFVDYQADPDLLEKTGCEVSALSEELKRVFGWKARTTGDGIVTFEERGPTVYALFRVFEDHFRRHPANNVLRKWIYDVMQGAEKAFSSQGTVIPSTAATLSGQKRDRSDSSSVSVPPPKSQKTMTHFFPTSPTKKRSRRVNINSDQGRKPDPLLHRLAIDALTEEGKPGWKCIAPLCNYTRAGNFASDRILKHSIVCQILAKYDPSAFRDATDASVGESLGSSLETASMNSTSPDPTAPSTSQKPVLSNGTLNVVPLRVAGAKAKAEANQLFQNEVDHIIMQLICIRGLVPNILDSPEWKQLTQKLNGLYKPRGSDAFRNDIIPKEAAFVRRKQVELLKCEENLTLTFDGTTIRGNESFYTAHATTPSRDTYFIDAHHGTGEHHDKAWITTNLLKTISDIGNDKWAASVSDSTNVTKAARRDVSAQIPTILDLRDSVHHIQLTIKDITNLEENKPFIRLLKAIIKHFSKSSFSVAKLREARNLAGEDEPVNGLQKVGRTRFGTFFLGSTSLEPCLPTIRVLVRDKTIKFKNTQVQGMLVSRASEKYADFETHMLWYNNIIAPLIRSLWSLEAATANASDVFVFWLAAGATLNDLFGKNYMETGIPRSLANQVTDIYNARFEEFFKNEIYFVAFILDPRYAQKDFLKESITIHIQSQETRATAQTSSATAPPTLYKAAYDRVRLYLRDVILRPMLDLIETSGDVSVGNPIFREKGPVKVLMDLTNELNAFWRDEYPFHVHNREQIVDPLAWWRELAKGDNSKVLAILAVKIFSILVNSMPDERTNSTITWLNSPTRGNQKAQNLVDIIQIGQWYRKEKKLDTVKERYRPAVKFRKISKATLERLQVKGDADDTENPELQDDEEGGTDIGEETERAVNGEEGEGFNTDLAPPVPIPTASQPKKATYVPRTYFKIDECININSPALLDMISEDPVLPEKPGKGNPSKRTTLEEKISVADAYAYF